MYHNRGLCGQERFARCKWNGSRYSRNRPAGVGEDHIGSPIATKISHADHTETGRNISQIGNCHNASTVYGPFDQSSTLLKKDIARPIYVPITYRDDALAGSQRSEWHHDGRTNNMIGAYDGCDRTYRTGVIFDEERGYVGIQVVPGGIWNHSEASRYRRHYGSVVKILTCIYVFRNKIRLVWACERALRWSPKTGIVVECGDKYLA